MGDDNDNDDDKNDEGHDNDDNDIDVMMMTMITTTVTMLRTTVTKIMTTITVGICNVSNSPGCMLSAGLFHRKLCQMGLEGCQEGLIVGQNWSLKKP